MLKEHSPNLNKYLEQPTELHSTCRHTQLMNRLHLQLQSKLLLSLSLSFLFATSVSVAAQNKTSCNALFAQRSYPHPPLTYLPQRQQCFASLGPHRAVPESLPESLAAWWPGCLTVGCLEMQSSTQCSRAANTTHKVIFILRPQVPLLLGLAWLELELELASWSSLCCHYDD